ncbi:2-iminoacetate synthase ThiH [Lachnobacterium bovis]|uniref:2-iminoacetate synthase ThiH n=1 Tax=Lachnobacterium bovis TaxID=140626 RepID=UPI0004847B10|nr:2-iminoacetate synthase ThiH [Lachnobacterium bovis]
MENQFLIDSDFLSEDALAKKHLIENNPSARSNPMEYMPDMERIDSKIKDRVISQMNEYDYNRYTRSDVIKALKNKKCTLEDFKALLSPAALPFLEQMAQKAHIETRKHFGNTVYIFTPLYIANYCENYCIYCGFNCYNHIKRMRLTMEQIEHEMKVIAESGMEEILILTGESKSKSDVKYIGEACKLAKKYFKNVGIEIYPVNTEDYAYLHKCGVDYVTVFQETYDIKKYETLHLLGHKRIWPYRFDAQERALRGGMRGVAFSALLGLADFRKDALATALHVYYLQKKYPHAEMSISCPRLRPIVNNDKINSLDVHEKQLCQIICAYRIFLPFAGITVSSRESKEFRNGIVKIAATKVSAGVSTGIGDHESKYKKHKLKDLQQVGSNLNDSNDTLNNGQRLETFEETGDEQFEINDTRSIDEMYADLVSEGLQPVLNDYLYVGE